MSKQRINQVDGSCVQFCFNCVNIEQAVIISFQMIVNQEEAFETFWISWKQQPLYRVESAEKLGCCSNAKLVQLTCPRSSESLSSQHALHQIISLGIRVVAQFLGIRLETEGLAEELVTGGTSELNQRDHQLKKKKKLVRMSQ